MLKDSESVVIGRYASAFSKQLFRLHEAEIESARLKREIELVQAAKTAAGSTQLRPAAARVRLIHAGGWRGYGREDEEEEEYCGWKLAATACGETRGGDREERMKRRLRLEARSYGLRRDARSYGLRRDARSYAGDVTAWA